MYFKQHINVGRLPGNPEWPFGAAPSVLCGRCRYITRQTESGVHWIQISLWEFGSRRRLKVVKKRGPTPAGDACSRCWLTLSRCLLYVCSIYATGGFPLMLWDVKVVIPWAVVLICIKKTCIWFLDAVMVFYIFIHNKMILYKYVAALSS